MNEAAQHLIGEHDFRNFCKMDVENGVTNFVRSIRRVDLKEINGSNEEETGKLLLAFGNVSTKTNS